MGEIADMMIDGLMCSHCGECFDESYDVPVLCPACFDSETEEERAGIQKAWLKEEA